VCQARKSVFANIHAGFGAYSVPMISCAASDAEWSDTFKYIAVLDKLV
jgi:hypothetical protein